MSLKKDLSFIKTNQNYGDIIKNEIIELAKEKFNSNLAFVVLDDSTENLLICLNNDQVKDVLTTTQSINLNKITINIEHISIVRDYIKYAEKSQPNFFLKNYRSYYGVKWAELIIKSETVYINDNNEFLRLKKLSILVDQNWRMVLESDHKVLGNNDRLANYLVLSVFNHDIEVKSLALAKKINEKKDQIYDLLTEVEPYNVVKEEIAISLDTLKKINLQYQYLKCIEGKVEGLSIFLPINLPLYSLVLYGLIPALAIEKVYIRTPLVIRKIFDKLIKILCIDSQFPGVELFNCDRATFRKTALSISDIVIFTGRYENVTKLLNEHADKMFIYNGAGINPFVIARDANIDLAVEKVVNMRLFNSGQDCAAPDAILVNTEIYDKFLEKLKLYLNKVKIGDYKDRTTNVGPLLNRGNLLANIKVLQTKKLLYGGLLDFVQGIIYPTIIESRIEDYNYNEYFAPIFNLVKYSDINDLIKFFDHKLYKLYAMYVSIFGTEPYIENLMSSVVLHNLTVEDVDVGYNEFGGYGKRANFIYYRGYRKSRPILIPRDIVKCIQGKY